MLQTKGQIELNLYVESFSTWYKANKKKTLAQIEDKLGVESFPYQRRNKVKYTLAELKLDHDYLPYTLMMLRENSHIEVSEIVVENKTQFGKFVGQLDSINSCLHSKSKFETKIVLNGK